MKIALVDYIGYGDAKGSPVGHVLKILNEYGMLVEKKYEIEYYVSKYYASKIYKGKVHKLPFFSDTTRRGKSTFYNLLTMIQSWINIHIALRTDANIIWFCNVDQFLFMYLKLWGFHHKKIVVSIFSTEYPKNIHNYCLKKVKAKVSLFISSNQQTQLLDNGFYMPDYLYSNKIYDIVSIRDDKIICLGTMSRSKKIKEIVQLCNELRWNLDVRGFFYDKAYYKEIIEIKNENVIIEDKYLEYDEYLKALSEAKYCFFNYDENAYANITSGVMLECIFMDCIPIANEFLLKKMNIAGIGYNKIDDIKNMNRNEIYLNNLIEKNRKIIKERYEQETVKEELLKRFSQI